MAWWNRRRRNSGVAEPKRAGLFFWQGQRRYLARVPYALPSDQEEINRLDLEHFMLRNALAGNFAAPLRHPLSILDVGCGTGRWPIEMAAQFPQANVVGIDIVMPPPSTHPLTDALPDNYAFVQANILEGLPLATRALTMCISVC